MNTAIIQDKTHKDAFALLNFGSKNKLPIVIQTEKTECGLACLAMIAGYYGFETDLVSLRSRFSPSSKGTTLESIISFASDLNFSTRALKAEPADLIHATLPCILHWGMNHFVVLKAIEKNAYILHDPAFGERKINNEEFRNKFTGILLELSPNQNFLKARDSRELKFSIFFTNAIGLRRSLSQIIILSLLLQLFALAGPFYLQTIVDDVLLRNDSDLLIVLAIGFCLLMLIQLTTNALREISILHLSSRLGMHISSNLFAHLIRLPLDYFARRHMGDIVSRFNSLDSIRTTLTNGLVTSVVDGVMAIFTIAALLIYSVTAGSTVILICLIYAALRWWMYFPFRMYNEEYLIADSKEKTHFMESIRAIQTIKLFMRESERQNQWKNRLASATNKNIKITQWKIRYSVINSFVFGIENILVLFLLAKAVMGNVISLGMLYAFMSYKDRFVRSIESLIEQWTDFKMLDLHIKRLSDIALAKPEDKETHLSSNFWLPINGKIEVKNLSFRYSPHEPYIFRNLNFMIDAGEAIAITGSSGSGKTTLLKCLMGLIDPTEGEIFIDDKPLKSAHGYRNAIAAVMQDDQLLSGDIAENISCFSPHIDMQKVILCAQLSCIHDDILKMPMQYNTLVGDMGSNLSGGQKQRIILARALYHQPRILFMDEATSHLDVKNEAVVSSHIRQLNITRVLIAHRPETVTSAGRQINLADNICQQN